MPPPEPHCAARTYPIQHNGAPNGRSRSRPRLDPRSESCASPAPVALIVRLDQSMRPDPNTRMHAQYSPLYGRGGDADVGPVSGDKIPEPEPPIAPPRKLQSRRSGGTYINPGRRPGRNQRKIASSGAAAIMPLLRASHPVRQRGTTQRGRARRLRDAGLELQSPPPVEATGNLIASTSSVHLPAQPMLSARRGEWSCDR